MENLIVKATKRNKFDFDLFFLHLKTYKQQFGDLLVPARYSNSNGYNLGSVVYRIRCHDIKINKQQELLLNDIGFVWNAKVFDFDKFYNELINYKNVSGNLLVPSRYSASNGYNLGITVSRIRSGATKITDQQKQLLNDIGFVWNAKKFFDFDKFYNELINYKKASGNLLVPSRYSASNGYKLGNIVHRIRCNDIKINDYQKHQLNDIGFVWSAEKIFKFDKFYNELVNYKNAYGNLLVPTNYFTSNGYNLGRYISRIRSDNIKINKQQKLLLNDIGFVWNATRVFDFDKFYNELIDYKNASGNLLVPQNYVSSNRYNLGNNVSRIRSNNIQINEYQKLLLNDIGFVWAVNYTKKIKNFNYDKFCTQLNIFSQNNNNLLVPYNYIQNGYELGFYTHNIRNHQIMLTKTETQLLAKLGFVFDTHNLLYSNINYSIKDSSQKLITNMLNGDMLARKTLIEKYISYVEKVALKFSNGLATQDLLGIAYDVLINCVDRARQYRTTFTAYVKKTLIAVIMKTIKNKYKNLSLDSNATDPDGLELIDTIADQSSSNPEEIVTEQKFNTELLIKIQNILSKSEFKLICLYYGFTKENQRYSITNLAKHYNTDEDSVKRAIIRIIKKLKSSLNQTEWNLTN